MPREARLANGDVLRFPDDTPDDVMDKAVHEYLHPVPGPGITPYANPPMEQSTIGKIYETGKEAVSQAGKLAKGTIETLTPVAAIKGMRGAVDMMRGDYTPPPNMITEPIKQQMLMPTDKPVMQRFADTTTALMGGDPDRAKQIMSESGSILPAMIAYAGIPLTGFLLGGIGKASRRVPTGATLDSTNAAISLIDPKAIRPTFEPLKAAGVSPIHMPADVDVMTGAAVLTQPLKQQAMNELGYTTKVFASREFGGTKDVMGNIKRGGKAALDVVDRAVDIAQRPIDATIKLYETQRVPNVQEAVINNLHAEAAKFSGIDDAISNALNTLAKNVESKGTTVGELNALKVHANKEIGNLIRGTQSQQVEASAHASYAYHVLADAVRHNLYPEIEKLGGIRITEYGTREAAAIMERDGVASTYYTRVVPNQATAATRGYLDRLIHGSLYKSHVARRALGLELTPMAEFNHQFELGLGNLGKGFRGETISGEITPGMNIPANRQLPSTTGNFSSTGKFQFSIPANESILSSIDVSETLKPTGINTKGVPKQLPPGRDFAIPGQPRTGGMLLTDTQSAPASTRVNAARGLTESTQPPVLGQGNLSNFPQGDPRLRRIQVDMEQQLAEKESAISNPSTTPRPEPNWTYAMPENDPMGVPGQALLQTTDPAVAVKALADITNRLRDTKLPLATRNKLLEAQESLTKQLQIYRTYENFQAPPGVKLNITPAKLGTKRKISPSAVAAKSARLPATGMIANREKE